MDPNTSCSSPFNIEKDFFTLDIVIVKGKRENPVPDTNHKFVEL